MSLAMRRGGLAGEIVGYARSKETRDIAREINLVDRVVDSAEEAVKDADLVVLVLRQVHAYACGGGSAAASVED